MTEQVHQIEKGTSLWADAWKRVLKNTAALIGAGIVAIMAFGAVTFELLSEHLTRFTFDEQHLSSEPKPMGARSVPQVHFLLMDGSESKFDEADTNKDGQIEREELSAWYTRMQFAWIDSNGDGFISPPEYDDRPLNKIQDSAKYTVFTLDRGVGTLSVNTNPSASFELSLGEDSVSVTPGADAAATASAIAQAIEGDFAMAGAVTVSAKGSIVTLGAKKTGPKGRLPYTSSDAGVVAAGEVLNGDLKLDPQEAHETDLSVLVPVSEARALIEKFDTDKDQKLSKAEFKGYPSPRTHWFGTDSLGRDMLTRCIMGARVSLMVGFIATFVSFLIGVMWGATAGFLGGKVDNAMMRFVDVMYGLPFMFLVILLMVIFQDIPSKHKLYLLFMALGAVQWLTMSRIVRGQVITLKSREFVEAAEAIGVRKRTIIVRHLIPNALGPIIVYSTLTVPAVMLEEAFLSFLGLGVQAPYASWGSLASEGAKAFQHYPWMIIFPGGLLAVTLLSLNFVGDGLRDALDPQVRKD